MMREMRQRIPARARRANDASDTNLVIVPSTLEAVPTAELVWHFQETKREQDHSGRLGVLEDWNGQSGESE